MLELFWEQLGGHWKSGGLCNTNDSEQRPLVVVLFNIHVMEAWKDLGSDGFIVRNRRIYFCIYIEHKWAWRQLTANGANSLQKRHTAGGSMCSEEPKVFTVNLRLKYSLKIKVFRVRTNFHDQWKSGNNIWIFSQLKQFFREVKWWKQLTCRCFQAEQLWLCSLECFDCL